MVVSTVGVECMAVMVVAIGRRSENVLSGCCVRPGEAPRGFGERFSERSVGVGVGVVMTRVALSWIVAASYWDCREIEMPAYSGMVGEVSSLR